MPASFAGFSMGVSHLPSHIISITGSESHQGVPSNRIPGKYLHVGQCLRTSSLHLDEKRPTRAVEELHQVAATRTERRLSGQVTADRQRRSWLQLAVKAERSQRKGCSLSGVGPSGVGEAGAPARKSRRDERQSEDKKEQRRP